MSGNSDLLKVSDKTLFCAVSFWFIETSTVSLDTSGAVEEDSLDKKFMRFDLTEVLWSP